MRRLAYVLALVLVALAPASRAQDQGKPAPSVEDVSKHYDRYRAEEQDYLAFVNELWARMACSRKARMSRLCFLRLPTVVRILEA